MWSRYPRALCAGRVEVVEVIRGVLGAAFAQGVWPRGKEGATLVHAAASNKLGDARCVWLALEAEGEPPGAGDEEAAAAAALAATTMAVAPPPPPPHNDRGGGRDATLGGGGGRPMSVSISGAAAAGVRPLSPPPPRTRPCYTLNDYASVAGPAAAAAHAAAAVVFIPSAASVGTISAGAGTTPAMRMPGPGRPAHLHAVAAVADDRGVTPLMIAADGGAGWEGCVAALLWSTSEWLHKTARGTGTGGVGGGGGSGSGAVDRRMTNAAAAVVVQDKETQSNAAHYAAISGAAASLRLLAAAHPVHPKPLDPRP